MSHNPGAGRLSSATPVLSAGRARRPRCQRRHRGDPSSNSARERL